MHKIERANIVSMGCSGLAIALDVALIPATRALPESIGFAVFWILVGLIVALAATGMILDKPNHGLAREWWLAGSSTGVLALAGLIIALLSTTA